MPQECYNSAADVLGSRYDLLLVLDGWLDPACCCELLGPAR
jgi:hypothetical protein